MPAYNVFSLPVPPALANSSTGHASGAVNVFSQPVAGPIVSAIYRMRGIDGSGAYVQWDEYGTPGSTNAPVPVTGVLVLRVTECCGSSVGGAVVLAGDVTGPAALSVVEKIHGRSVSPAMPSAGQVLKWNGTAWAPDTDSGTDGAVFTASSTETLSVGMFVAAGGIDVIRADANDPARVPAIGVVVAVNGPGSYQVRTAGVATSMPGSYASRSLILGSTGYAVTSSVGLSHIQTVGIWMDSGRINVNLSPQVFTNP